MLVNKHKRMHMFVKRRTQEGNWSTDPFGAKCSMRSVFLEDLDTWKLVKILHCLPPHRINTVQLSHKWIQLWSTAWLPRVQPGQFPTLIELDVRIKYISSILIT